MHVNAYNHVKRFAHEPKTYTFSGSQAATCWQLLIHCAAVIGISFIASVGVYTRRY